MRFAFPESWEIPKRSPAARLMFTGKAAQKLFSSQKHRRGKGHTFQTNEPFESGMGLSEAFLKAG